jgi:hypothetical protein
MKYLALFVFTFITLIPLSSQTIYNSVQSGVWSNPATWDSNGVPQYTFTNDDQIIINEGHTISEPSALTFYNTSSLRIEGELVCNPGYINLYDNSNLVNNGLITLDNGSAIFISNNSTLTNNGTILGEMNTFILLSGSATLYTCLPEPVDQSMDPNSLIINNDVNSTILAPVPLGNPCDDGNELTINSTWDGDCGCSGGIAVPTLSQWGIIALILLILTLGVITLNNRNSFRLRLKY